MLESNNNNLSVLIEGTFAKNINSFEKITQRGPGWTLEKKVLHLELSATKYSNDLKSLYLYF